MRTATLTRLSTGDDGTFGEIVTDLGFRCVCVELPWRDNARGKSCILPGVYPVAFRYSPKHGDCYHVDRTQGRTEVQLHSANWAGDADKGFKSQLEGCIAPGRAILPMEYAPGKVQKGVTESKTTLWNLESNLKQEPFELTVKWAPGVGPKEA